RCPPWPAARAGRSCDVDTPSEGFIHSRVSHTLWRNRSRSVALDETQSFTYSLLNIFYDGGLFMYPLVLCSLFALGIIIAKGYTVWAAHRESAKILNETEALMKQKRLDQALKLSAETPGPVAAIMYSGLRRLIDRQSS